MIENITIDVSIKRVSTYKLLGVNLSSNLKWNDHIKQAATRIYSVTLLRRAGVPVTDLVAFYATSIRPVLEFVCPVWFYDTTECLGEQMKFIERRIMRIIFPGTNSSAMCEIDTSL